MSKTNSRILSRLLCPSSSFDFFTDSFSFLMTSISFSDWNCLETASSMVVFILRVRVIISDLDAHFSLSFYNVFASSFRNFRNKRIPFSSNFDDKLLLLWIVFRTWFHWSVFFKRQNDTFDISSYFGSMEWNAWPHCNDIQLSIFDSIHIGHPTHDVLFMIIVEYRSYPLDLNWPFILFSTGPQSSCYFD